MQMAFVIESEVDEAIAGPFVHVPISNGPADINEPLIAISRLDRPVNRLSTAAIEALVTFMKQKNRLVEVDILTGSSDFNCSAWLSRYRNAGSSSSAQLTVPQGSLAELELDEWQEQQFMVWEGLDPAERPSAPPMRPANRKKAYLVNVAHVVWRHLHRFPDTNECKWLMHNFECSHRAEAYDMFAWPAFEGDEAYQGTNYPFPHDVGTPGWRVEISEQESFDINDTRKLCAKYGLMWRRSDGSLILEDDYVGPTMCIHQAWGFPCFAPRPTAFVPVPALAVPPRQKTRQSGRKRPTEEEDAQPALPIPEVGA